MSGLWPFALGVYPQPGAQSMLLALQDEHDQCVSYLIWAGWAAVERRMGDAAPAAALAVDVDARVLSPMRAVRRALSTPRQGLDDSAREALRRQAADTEVAAERVLLESLEALSPPTPAGAVTDAKASFLGAASAWPTPAPTKDLHALWRMFAAFGSC